LVTPTVGQNLIFGIGVYAAQTFAVYKTKKHP